MSVTGRERVRAALALDVADRPPVSAWGHDYDQEWGVESLVSSTVSRARTYGFDFVKLQIRATVFAEAFGARFRYSGSADAEPVQEGPGATDAEGWRRVAQGPSNPAVLSDQVEVLQRVVTELGPDVPVLQTVFSPGMVAWFLAGRDSALLARLLREEPALLAAALDQIAAVLARFTTDSLAAGAAGVFYAINPLADSNLVPPDEYDALYLPGDRAATAAAAEGWFNMLHLCGGHINQRIGRELGMHCVNWALEDPGNPGLADLRDRLGLAVAGGVGRYSPIRSEDPAEVRTMAEAALQATGGRGHLLTPGCSTSPWGRVKPENLRALIASAG